MISAASHFILLSPARTDAAEVKVSNKKDLYIIKYPRSVIKVASLMTLRRPRRVSFLCCSIVEAIKEKFQFSTVRRGKILRKFFLLLLHFNDDGRDPFSRLSSSALFAIAEMEIIFLCFIFYALRLLPEELLHFVDPYIKAGLCTSAVLNERRCKVVRRAAKETFAIKPGCCKLVLGSIAATRY